MSLFSSLHIFTAHVKPEQSGSPDRIVFVKEGFNWWAFLFTTIWVLYHRLWLMGGFLIAANIGLVWLIEELHMDVASLSILQFALQLWVGFQANDFLRSKLKKQGYITTALVSGENVMRAEQRFFDQHSELLANA